MTLAIIGAGKVGIALGKASIRAGQAVCFGVTDKPKHAAAISALGPKAEAKSVPEAIAAADMVILAVPYASAKEIASATPDWGGKILIDATNPLTPGLKGLDPSGTTSAAEEIAKCARNARVIKAFNTTGADNLENASYPDGRIFMPVCGDDAEARKRVMAVAASLGFEPVDYGALDGARYLEPLAMVWIKLATAQGMGRNFAFAILRR